ncbi:MAG: hypothetical protein LBG28_04055 [Tannerella sp.]|jgi:hypothetical protein|nr:hypothetical protein [Tannerella sp.]
MFGHRSFLVIGGDGPADIRSLESGGYEMAHCNFGLKQGVGTNGKVTTAVHSGVIDLRKMEESGRRILAARTGETLSKCAKNGEICKRGWLGNIRT